MGGEFIITWGGFMAIVAFFMALGLAVGWMGGRFEGHAQERALHE